MCGIAGLLDYRKTHGDSQHEIIVRGMIQELAHRGPDGSGVWSDSDQAVVLGHRRLAVQDLSENGHQPMVSASGRYVISFNGEIYNFKTLRAELISAGHRFRGGSDTEVILAATEAWGLQATLPKISGMFAFAIWDRSKATLTLARDRLGEKPLYWGVFGNCLAFASELKALRKLPDWQHEIDPNMLAAYFRYGYVPAPFSIFRSVFKLPAGCYLSVPLDRLRSGVSCSPSPNGPGDHIGPVPYWTLAAEVERARNSPITDPKLAVAGLKNCLTNAVQQQLIADVPVGAFLSGGIDSSMIVAIAQELREQPLKTFTISFPGSSHDESVFAQRVAAHLGTDHFTLPLTPQDVLDTVPLLPRISDEPFGNPSQIPVYLLSKFAREQVTVCLSGDGGDELFAGYNRYVKTDQLWRYLQRSPRWGATALGSALSMLPFGAINAVGDVIHRHFPQQRVIPPAMGLKLQKLAGALGKSNLNELYLYLRSFWDSPLELVPEACCDLNIGDAVEALVGDFEFIERAMYLDTLTYLPDDGLAKVDRAAMAVGLETRLPLLDTSVVSYAWQLPVALKIRENQTKWCLRELLRSYLPPELIDRPKVGFTVPISEWLRGPLREWAEAILLNNANDQRDGLNGDVIRRIWREHQKNSRDNGLILWAIINFREWHREFHSG